MRRVLGLILPLIFAVAGTLAMSPPAHAASYGVQDKGHLFSDDAVTKAQGIIRQIRSGDDRDVLVMTFAALTPEQQDLLKTQGKQHFYSGWAEDIGKENGVKGIVILLVKDPGHLEIDVGNNTRQHSFTLDDRDQLSNRVMLPLLKDKDYDNALIKGLGFIRDHMQRSQSNAGAASNVPPPPYSSNSIPPSPTTHNPSPSVTPSSGGFPIMGFVCIGIVILGVVFVIMKLVNRNQSYGGGYNAPPPGGYPPGYSGGGYPQGGGYGGGGGGGFGRGLLGGLLGGALGAWGYERFNQGSPSNPNYIPPQTGAPGGGNYGNSNDQTDTSFSGTGGDFGSSTDSGGSSSDSGSSGSDFGSSDSSGGGSDFGSSGGDFGGGGGDSGGGGGGGDF